MGFTFMFLTPVITIPLGSLFFKFNDRDWLFDHLQLSGSENVLDVGCGHGLLLIGAAKRLTSGKAHGLDLWAQADQANNSKEATLRNARIEKVENKIEIHNGDMTMMPFADSTFDGVVSSWAIHNIYDRVEREKALAEINRVLKPGGKIAILDIDHAPSYRDYFQSRGLQNMKLLGPRFTFGNRTYLVLGQKAL
jgi:ubiquinone/menaquinone biosynthesis C-methylase UbiE